MASVFVLSADGEGCEAYRLYLELSGFTPAVSVLDATFVVFMCGTDGVIDAIRLAGYVNHFSRERLVVMARPAALVEEMVILRAWARENGVLNVTRHLLPRDLEALLKREIASRTSAAPAIVPTLVYKYEDDPVETCY